jgi:hypothetical protein
MVIDGMFMPKKTIFDLKIGFLGLSHIANNIKNWFIWYWRQNE